MTSSQFCSHGNLWPDARRARDEAIIRAVCNFLPVVYDDDYPLPKRDIDAIIVAAEQETP